MQMPFSKDLEMRKHPGLSRWTLSAITRILIRQRQREIPQDWDYRSRDWSDDKPKTTGSHRSAGKARKWILPWSLQKDQPWSIH